MILYTYLKSNVDMPILYINAAYIYVNFVIFKKNTVKRFGENLHI